MIFMGHGNLLLVIILVSILIKTIHQLISTPNSLFNIGSLWDYLHQNWFMVCLHMENHSQQTPAAMTLEQLHLELELVDNIPKYPDFWHILKSVISSTTAGHQFSTRI